MLFRIEVFVSTCHSEKVSCHFSQWREAFLLWRVLLYVSTQRCIKAAHGFDAWSEGCRERLFCCNICYWVFLHRDALERHKGLMPGGLHLGWYAQEINLYFQKNLPSCPNILRSMFLVRLELETSIDLSSWHVHRLLFLKLYLCYFVFLFYKFCLS